MRSFFLLILILAAGCAAACALWAQSTGWPPPEYLHSRSAPLSLTDPRFPGGAKAHRLRQPRPTPTRTRSHFFPLKPWLTPGWKWKGGKSPGNSAPSPAAPLPRQLQAPKGGGQAPAAPGLDKDRFKRVRTPVSQGFSTWKTPVPTYWVPGPKKLRYPTLYRDQP